MRFGKFIWRISWKTGCTLCHCLNAVLALIALLLTALILLDTVQREIPLPDQLARAAIDRILGETYRADWNQAVFDLRGGLYLEDFALDNRANGESVLSADAVRIDFALIHLLFGFAPAVSELTAIGVELYIPAHLSPSGVNESVLEIPHLEAQSAAGQLTLSTLHLQSRGIRLMIEGSAPYGALLGQKGSGDGLARYHDLLRSIHKLPADLELQARLDWRLTEVGTHFLTISALSDTFPTPIGEIEQANLTSSLAVIGNRVVVTSLQLDGRLVFLHPDTSLSLPRPFTLNLPMRFSLDARGLPVMTGPFSLPASLSLVLHQPLSQPYIAHTARLRTSLVEQNPVIRAVIDGPGLFAALDIEHYFPNFILKAVDPPPPNIQLDLTLQDPRLFQFFPDLPQHRLLENAHCRHLRFSARSVPFSDHYEGFLITDGLYIGQTPFAHVHAAFSASPTALDAFRIHVARTGPEQATGSYYHHFKSARFSLNAVGAIYPDALDVILGSWWQKIFTDIEATSPVPGDVTVWGHWTGADRIRSFTRAHGQAVQFRGQRVPDLEVRIRSTYEWALLERLAADFGGYRVDGRIGWRLNLPDPVRRPVLLEFRSDAPWEVVRRLSALEPLEAYYVGGRPLIGVEGTVWRSSREDRKAGREMEVYPDMTFELHQRSGESRLIGLDLERLSLTGRISGRNLEFPIISGMLAEGVFTGDLRVDNWNSGGDELRTINLSIFDADYRQLIMGLTGLMQEPEGLRKSLLRDADTGRIEADLKMILAPGLEGTSGSGRITLRQAQIGRIHLLGGLSRTLDNMGMGFSTADIETGFLVWELENGILEIPQVLLTGPVLSLDAAGTVDLSTKNLNLSAEATLFKGLVSMFLTPVSETVQFDLSGPFEAPVWKLRLNPLRWFSNRVPGNP